MNGSLDKWLFLEILLQPSFPNPIIGRHEFRVEPTPAVADVKSGTAPTGRSLFRLAAWQLTGVSSSWAGQRRNCNQEEE